MIWYLAKNYGKRDQCGWVGVQQKQHPKRIHCENLPVDTKYMPLVHYYYPAASHFIHRLLRHPILRIYLVVLP